MSGVSLSTLLAEVDRLERELKDLGREAQTGRDFVNQLEELVERDVDKVAETEKEVGRISRQISEWEERERFLTNAISSATQSSQLLVQMEMQARSKLEEERKVTYQLKEQLKSKIVSFSRKVDMEESRYMKIPSYVKLVNTEEVVKRKKEMVEQLETELGHLTEEHQAFDKEKKNDREAWIGFRGVCVNLAEQWLMWEKLKKELNEARREKQEVTEQVDKLVAERNVTRETVKAKSASSNGQDIASSSSTELSVNKITDTEAGKATLSLPTLKSGANTSFRVVASQEPAARSVTNPAKNIGTLPVRSLALVPARSVAFSNASLLPPLTVAPSQPSSASVISPMLQSTSLESSSVTPPQHRSTITPPPQHVGSVPVDMEVSSHTTKVPTRVPSLSMHTTPAYVPPTPRTKQLQLKLGASLLNTRKKSAVSLPKPDVPLSFPTAMPPPQVTPVTTPIKSRPEPVQPVKMKSLKLSLLGRKKPEQQVSVQHSRSMEETLARSPTVICRLNNSGPREDRQALLPRSSTGELNPSCSTGAVQQQSQGTDETLFRNSTVLANDDVDMDVEENVPRDDFINRNDVQSTAIAAIEHPKVVNNVTSKANDGNTEGLVPSNSSLCSGTPPMDRIPLTSSIRPDTALSNQQRQAMLQQLLESPQPVVHARKQEEKQTVLSAGLERKEVEQIVTFAKPDSDKAKNKDVAEEVSSDVGMFNFEPEASASFNFGDSSFNFGGDGKMDSSFNFGGDGKVDSSFNFGGDGKVDSSFNFGGDGSKNPSSIRFGGNENVDKLDFGSGETENFSLFGGEDVANSQDGGQFSFSFGAGFGEERGGDGKNSFSLF